MKTEKHLNVHPMVVFWLGVLTGALILGVIFLERTMNMLEYQSALYKYVPKIENQLDKGKYVMPKSLEPKSFDKSLQLEDGGTMEKLSPDAYSIGTNPIPTP